MGVLLVYLEGMKYAKNEANEWLMEGWKGRKKLRKGREAERLATAGNKLR